MSNYQTLNNILQAALDRASIGKGGERHGTEEPFEQQGMSRRNRQYGTAFGLGQIDKKLEETVRFFENGQIRRGINELLDIIVYSAGVIIVAEEQLLVADFAERVDALQAVDGHPDVDNSACDTPDPVQLNNETFEQFITDEVREKLIADAVKYGQGFGFMDESGRISNLDNSRVVVLYMDHGTDEGTTVTETQETYAEGQQPQPAGDYQRMPPVSYAFTLTEHAARVWNAVSELTADRMIKRAEYLINKNRLGRTEAAAFRKFVGAAFAMHVGYINWDGFDGYVNHKAVNEPGWEKLARAADLLAADLLAGGNVFKDPSELLASL